MIIRSFADLHLLKDALINKDNLNGSGAVMKTLSEEKKTTITTRISELVIPLQDDLSELAEIEDLLRRHDDLWLGFSPVKGWVLLDRKHPEYNDWNRPFILLRDGSIDRLSREEFGNEPKGPWSLHFWKLLDNATKTLAGSVVVLLPAIRNYIQEAEQLRAKELERLEELRIKESELVAQLIAKHTIDRNEDLATRIDESRFSADIYSSAGLEFQDKWATAKREHYAAALPPRVRWLSCWAKRIQEGALGLEPAWGRGVAAADHLIKNGIHHLWHFTDIRNLDSIQHEGGLLSYSGLSAFGFCAHLVANDYSRSCDLRLGREYYVRLSFIPNSWYFQRIYKQSHQSGLIWLRFSLQSLALGEVTYSLGNAASSYVCLQNDLPYVGINWKWVRFFSGRHVDNKGEIIYPGLYPYEVGDDVLFQQIRNMWNSEILIKHFLPLKFCSGAFDCHTGKIILIQ
ncbi:MAG: DarT ssDNA thymidine ADP-ribosyltransferase family protein [Methylococcaceae bacterium]